VFKWWEGEEDVPLNQDWCVSIIDYNDKVKIKKFTNQKYDISLLVNLMGDQIATGYGEEISIWDLQSDCLKLNAFLKGHKDNITSLLFVEKENLLLSSSGDMTIIVNIVLKQLKWILRLNLCYYYLMDILPLVGIEGI
jgi:WD40 repeat protein